MIGGSSRAWRELRSWILYRDGFRCQIKAAGCTGHGTEVDHIQPLIQGGSMWDPDNLRASCAYCNRSRGARVRQRGKGGTWSSVRASAPEVETRF